MEYRDRVQNRWVRVDPEILGSDFVTAPEDLCDGEFLTVGKAWIMCRRGPADPASFGVDRYPRISVSVRSEATLMRDLAALNKVETLPSDAWGRIAAGETGPGFDELMDEVAATCASNDEQAVAVLYARQGFAAPSTLP